MSKFLRILFGMGKKSAADADNTLTKKLVAANPRLALEAELERRENATQDWAQRLIAAQRALAKDQRETADAEDELARRKANLEGLKAKLDGADEAETARIMQLAAAESEKFVRAQANLERERSEDALKATTLEKIEQGHKASRAAVEKLKGQIEISISRLEAAQAETDAAKATKALDAELAGLSDPLAESNIALAALDDAVADAEDELAVLELSGKTPGQTDHDDAVAAVLAGEESDEPIDPFAVLGKKKKAK